jgi:hypothetical protein
MTVEPTEAKCRKVSQSILENLTLPNLLLTAADDTLFEPYFRVMADYLLNDVVLCINNGKTKCRLAEIEFYFTSAKGVHHDPVSHKHPIMKLSGQWYFLQSFSKTNDDNYRGGNYKGFNITFGFKDETEEQYYGGILIRALEELDENGNRKKYIEGPSKSVDFVLSKVNAKTQHELVTEQFPEADPDTGMHLSVEKPSDSDHYPLYLESYHYNTRLPFVQSSRVGNVLKQKIHIPDRLKFLLKPYRFCIYPKDLKKAKNQVIISLYHQKLKQNLTKEEIIDEICNKIGAKVKKVEEYIKLYEQGMKNSVSSVDGVLAVDNAKPYFGRDLSGTDFCKLHGVLHELY